MPQRSTDLVETFVARALAAGGIGIVFLALSAVMFKFQGESGLSLAIVLGVIGLAAAAYAVFSFVKSRKVSAFKLDCPMCGAANGFAEMPNSDVICTGCHRTIPIMNGKLMPLKQISCGACGESNWYSDRTKTLLCEACGKEIAIASGSGEGGAQYAVPAEARPYQVLLTGYQQGSDDLVEALQELLNADRSGVRVLMTGLPSVLQTNVPRHVADRLAAELSQHGARVEVLPVD